MTITLPASTVPLSPAAEAWLRAINAPGVNVVNVAWETTVTPAAAHKARVLTKQTVATVMTGQSFAGLAVNNDRETGALPWGEWAIYPYIRTHTVNGERRWYARLNTVDGTLRTTYLIDGHIVAKADFDALLTPSARDKARPVGGTVDVRLDNLTIL